MFWSSRKKFVVVALVSLFLLPGVSFAGEKTSRGETASRSGASLMLLIDTAHRKLEALLASFGERRDPAVSTGVAAKTGSSADPLGGNNPENGANQRCGNTADPLGCGG